MNKYLKYLAFLLIAVNTNAQQATNKWSAIVSNAAGIGTNSDYVLVLQAASTASGYTNRLMELSNVLKTYIGLNNWKAAVMVPSAALSNIVGLASTVFTNVPLGGTNINVRTTGGTNFFDVTGYLAQWALYPTNGITASASNAIAIQQGNGNSNTFTNIVIISPATISGSGAALMNLYATNGSSWTQIKVADNISNVSITLPTNGINGIMFATATSVSNIQLFAVPDGTVGQALFKTTTGYAYSNAASSGGSSVVFTNQFLRTNGGNGQAITFDFNGPPVMDIMPTNNVGIMFTNIPTTNAADLLLWVYPSGYTNIAFSNGIFTLNTNYYAPTKTNAYQVTWNGTNIVVVPVQAPPQSLAIYTNQYLKTNINTGGTITLDWNGPPVIYIAPSTDWVGVLTNTPTTNAADMIVWVAPSGWTNGTFTNAIQKLPDGSIGALSADRTATNGFQITWNGTNAYVYSLQDTNYLRGDVASGLFVALSASIAAKISENNGKGTNTTFYGNPTFGSLVVSGDTSGIKIHKVGNETNTVNIGTNIPYSFGRSGINFMSDGKYPGVNGINIIDYGAYLGLTNTASDITNYQRTVTGLYKLNWSMVLAQNLVWDDTIVGNPFWRQIITNIPSCMLECGGEGVSIHVVPAGVTNHDTASPMIFRAAAMGPAGIIPYRGSWSGDSNQVQFKAPIVMMRATNDSEFWSHSYLKTDDPMIWLESASSADHRKGGFIRIEMNNPSATAGGIFFRKARGSIKLRAATTNADVVGNMEFDGYDGSTFQRSAAFRGVVDGTVSTGIVPIGFAWLAGSNVTTLSEKMRLTFDGTLRTTNVTVADSVTVTNNLTINKGFLKVGPSGGSITNILLASATLDFPSTSSGSIADLPITVSGVADGDLVEVGVPSGSITTILGSYSGFASNGAVYVRFVPVAATQDPASGTFKVKVTKF